MLRVTVKSRTALKKKSEEQEGWQISHRPYASAEPVLKYILFTRVTASPMQGCIPTLQPETRKKKSRQPEGLFYMWIILLVSGVFCWELIDNFLWHLMRPRMRPACRTLPGNVSTQCLSIVNSCCALGVCTRKEGMLCCARARMGCTYSSGDLRWLAASQSLAPLEYTP